MVSRLLDALALVPGGMVALVGVGCTEEAATTSWEDLAVAARTPMLWRPPHSRHQNVQLTAGNFRPALPKGNEPALTVGGEAEARPAAQRPRRKRDTRPSYLDRWALG